MDYVNVDDFESTKGDEKAITLNINAQKEHIQTLVLKQQI